MFSHFSVLSSCLGVLCGICAGLYPATSVAEGSARAVAVVDMQRVLTESIAGKAIKNSLEDEARKGEVRLKGLQVKLKKEEENLRKQSALLSESALVEKREALQSKARGFQRQAEDLKDDLDRKKQREIGRVVDDIDSVIKTLASEEGVEFVLEKDPKFIVYASGELDWTERVIEELDKRKIDL